MPSMLFTVICLASAAQASGAVSKMARKATVVEADGSLRTRSIALSDLTSSVLALDTLKTDQYGKMTSKLQDILTQFEGFAARDESPDPDTINTIKEIVVATLLPNLNDTHAATVKQVATNLAQIANCDAHSSSRLADINKTTEAIVGEQRRAHKDCRGGEEDKVTKQEVECKKLDDFLDVVQVPQTRPPSGNPADRDTMVHYCNHMDTYFCPKGHSVESLEGSCTAASKAESDAKADCDKKQHSFESAFCTWRTEMQDACSSGKTCYDNALKVYDNHVAATSELIKSWKTELAALKKIICYLDVFLLDATADKEEAFKQCKSNSIATSEMDIDFGSPADLAKCSLTAVEVHPGTDGFAAAEYASVSKYTVIVTPCI